MLPMAVPGMVLGLAYIFFFNDPRTPLHFLYGTMAILVVCTVTHFYTVSHLPAMTALKQMAREFESVAASLKQPLYHLFRVVTMQEIGREHHRTPVHTATIVCRLMLDKTKNRDDLHKRTK